MLPSVLQNENVNNKHEEIFHSSSDSLKSNKISLAGKIIIGVTGGCAICISLVCSSFIRPAFRKVCLPYIPATDVQLKNVLTALKGRRGSLLDIGSGDGRIVFETCKKGFVSHGVELNIWLIIYSKINAYRLGLQNQATFFRNDLWKYDVSKYENIVVFGVEEMMSDLEQKLNQQCSQTCRIIACRFPLPSKKPIYEIGCGIDKVWVYNM